MKTTTNEEKIAAWIEGAEREVKRIREVGARADLLHLVGEAQENDLRCAERVNNLLGRVAEEERMTRLLTVATKRLADGIFNTKKVGGALDELVEYACDQLGCQSGDMISVWRSNAAADFLSSMRRLQKELV